MQIIDLRYDEPSCGALVDRIRESSTTCLAAVRMKLLRLKYLRVLATVVGTFDVVAWCAAELDAVVLRTFLADDDDDDANVTTLAEVVALLLYNLFGEFFGLLKL